MARYAIVRERSELAATAQSSVHPIHAVARPGGSIEAEIDGSSVDLTRPATARIEFEVGALRADNALVDRELHKRLDARRYPTVTAEVRKVAGGTGGRYDVAVDLTLRHLTRTVHGWAELAEAEGDTVVVTAGLTFDVREFQLDPPSFFGLRVHPDVAVRLRVTATLEH